MQPRTWFIVDAQLSPRRVQQLTAAGFPSLHVGECLSATARDAEIAALANSLGSWVMRKDEDFAELLDRQVLTTGLVWVRVGNADHRRLWQVIEPELPRIRAAIEARHRLVEIP